MSATIGGPPEHARAREAVDAVAAAYDVFTADHDHERWTALIESLAREHGLAATGRLLDVGCGTGKSFLPWLERGWSVTGCDFSPAMLAQAAAKAPEARLVEADARALGDLGAFDLVLLLSDVVNLVPAGELPAVFDGVLRNLAAGGLVVFDLNTLATFRSFFGATEVRATDACVVTWRGGATAEFAAGDAADAAMEAFVLDGDGEWRRGSGVQREYHHPLDRVERTLRESGLEPVAAYGQDEEGRVDAEPDELAHSKLLVLARRRPSERLELRPTVEAFPASDGAIYFLRGGCEAEHVLDEPSATDRAVLERLHGECTLAELHALGPAGEVDELLAALDGLGLVARPGAARARLPLGVAARYDRQLLYFAAETGDDDRAAEAQRALMQATVCVIGCGGLGSWTAAALACAGIGGLVLVDDDRVEPSNLNRQLLFRHADVGRPKVEAAADALRAFDPDLEVTAIARRVGGPGDVEACARGASLIVGSADSPPFAVARWINAAAFALGIPHVSCGQLPPHVRVGPLFVPGDTGCAGCQDIAARRDYPEYDALVAYRERHDRPAAALGPLSALVGSILAMDVVHLLTGIATPATHGHAVVIDGRDLSVTREPVPREAGCTVCGPHG